MTVVMMEGMSLDDWDEKSEKKKDDQDKGDIIRQGMRQEVFSKGKEMHNEMSNLWFLKRKTIVVERW